jgi:hypothetical protein
MFATCRGRTYLLNQTCVVRSPLRVHGHWCCWASHRDCRRHGELPGVVIPYTTYVCAGCLHIMAYTLKTKGGKPVVISYPCNPGGSCSTWVVFWSLDRLRVCAARMCTRLCNSMTLPGMLRAAAYALQFDCDGDRRDFAKQQVRPSCNSCTATAVVATATAVQAQQRYLPQQQLYWQQRPHGLSGWPSRCSSCTAAHLSKDCLALRQCVAVCLFVTG